jgi:hypothetical protein
MNRWLFAIVFLFAPQLQASCGSASCPLDTNALNQPRKGEFTLDLSLQYIDQDQARIGTHSASIGEIHGPHHDEVRTLNRIGTATLGYAPSDRVLLTLSIPYVSRDHNHLASNHTHAGILGEQHNVIPEAWQLRGVGDVVLQSRWNTARGLWLIAGVKLPTGSHDLKNDEGEAAELPVQPGSGTTDGIAGVSFQRSFDMHTPVRGPLGNYALVPWFVTATYQFRGGATDGYRLGDEFQLSAGTVYPLTHRLELLAQLNTRIRKRDEIEDEPEEEPFTGGTYVYASPGLRFSLGRTAVYTLVQFPIYERVNKIQLTSKQNYVIGLQTRF